MKRLSIAAVGFVLVSCAEMTPQKPEPQTAGPAPGVVAPGVVAPAVVAEAAPKPVATGKPVRAAMPALDKAVRPVVPPDVRPAKPEERGMMPLRAMRSMPVLRGKASALKGAVSAEAVDAVVKKHRRELLKCYRGALEPGTAPSRLVRVAVTLGGDGAVATRLLNNRTGSATLGRCVEQETGKWPFAAPADGSAASFNLSFTFASLR